MQITPGEQEQEPVTASSTAVRPLMNVERARRSELTRSWGRFVRYRPALVGLGFLIVLVLISVAAPVIAPYSPTYANPEMIGVGPSASHLLGYDEIGRAELS